MFLYMPVKGGLQPSRRRSLFTLASYMLIFSARAGNFPDLIPKIKASLTEATVSFFTKPPFDLLVLQLPFKIDCEHLFSFFFIKIRLTN